MKIIIWWEDMAREHEKLVLFLFLFLLGLLVKLWTEKSIN